MILKKIYNNLLLRYFLLRKNMKETKDKLDKTKDDTSKKLDKTKDDTSKKLYDFHGFDINGKHKDTGTFLDKKNDIRKDISKNIKWLKDKDKFLKLYDEIVKNGEFSEKLKKTLFHQRRLKISYNIY